MKKLIAICFVLILTGYSNAFSQSQTRSTKKPNVEAGAEKAEVPSTPVQEKPKAEPSKSTKGEIKTIDGRPVYVDSQGIQSLEAVEPAQKSQPKVEKSVK